MDEIRIDRLEERLDELAAESRAGFAAVDARSCRNESRFDKIESRLDKIDSRLDKIDFRLEQTATKADLADMRTEMYRLNGEMKGWMVATTLTMMATFLAALFGLQRLAG